MFVYDCNRFHFHNLIFFHTNHDEIVYFVFIQALEYIHNLNTQLGNLKSQENNIRKGLNIFKIDQPPSHLILTLEKDLGHLQSIWELTSEWESAWDSWKSGTFGSLMTDEMGLQAQGMLKRLGKLTREVKVYYVHHYNDITIIVCILLWYPVGQELVYH